MQKLSTLREYFEYVGLVHYLEVPVGRILNL